jgi:hypothetical protein
VRSRSNSCRHAGFCAFSPTCSRRTRAHLSLTVAPISGGLNGSKEPNLDAHRFAAGSPNSALTARSPPPVRVQRRGRPAAAPDLDRLRVPARCVRCACRKHLQGPGARDGGAADQLDARHLCGDRDRAAAGRLARADRPSAALERSDDRDHGRQLQPPDGERPPVGRVGRRRFGCGRRPRQRLQEPGLPDRGSLCDRSLRRRAHPSPALRLRALRDLLRHDQRSNDPHRLRARFRPSYRPRGSPAARVRQASEGVRVMLRMQSIRENHSLVVPLDNALSRG